MACSFRSSTIGSPVFVDKPEKNFPTVLSLRIFTAATDADTVEYLRRTTSWDEWKRACMASIAWNVSPWMVAQAPLEAMKDGMGRTWRGTNEGMSEMSW